MYGTTVYPVIFLQFAGIGATLGVYRAEKRHSDVKNGRYMQRNKDSERKAERVRGGEICDENERNITNDVYFRAIC